MDKFQLQEAVLETQEELEATLKAYIKLIEAVNCVIDDPKTPQYMQDGMYNYLVGAESIRTKK